jgi:hypothetical protein
MFDRNGSARAPAGEISSVEMLSPTLSSTGASIWSGSGESSGRLEMLGPFTGTTEAACSASSGATSIAVFTEDCAGKSGLGWCIPAWPAQFRGSVITPVSADAAAVSGEHNHTESSLVPERPGKLRGIVRSELRPTAGACPTPMAELEEQLNKRGFMNRFFGRITKSITKT